MSGPGDFVTIISETIESSSRALKSGRKQVRIFSISSRKPQLKHNESRIIDYSHKDAWIGFTHALTLAGQALNMCRLFETGRRPGLGNLLPAEIATRLLVQDSALKLLDVVKTVTQELEGVILSSDSGTLNPSQPLPMRPLSTVDHRLSTLVVPPSAPPPNSPATSLERRNLEFDELLKTLDAAIHETRPETEGINTNASAQPVASDVNKSESANGIKLHSHPHGLPNNNPHLPPVLPTLHTHRRSVSEPNLVPDEPLATQSVPKPPVRRPTDSEVATMTPSAVLDFYYTGDSDGEDENEDSMDVVTAQPAKPIHNSEDNVEPPPLPTPKHTTTTSPVVKLVSVMNPKETPALSTRKEAVVSPYDVNMRKELAAVEDEIRKLEEELSKIVKSKCSK
ncbi:hypothetical protein HDU93_000522 [Gonapodya sp. JEL0774]|nr:hypothetical protein HDU93_000522 [Gonapodya sp. JEL0774]